ncbi:MAG: hypothetical protein V4666_10470 [Bacteroidota bacterium]
MKKLAIIIVFSLFSCQSYKEIKDKELVVFSSKSLGEFQSLSNQKKKTDYQISIQELFEIRNLDEIVKISISKNDEMEIYYKNVLGGNEVATFKGKFKKNYFEVYLSKKRIFFPPVYCKTNINRLRIGVTQNKDLVVNQHYDYSGMFMLFAAGNSDKKQYIFKRK